MKRLCVVFIVGGLLLSASSAVATDFKCLSQPAVSHPSISRPASRVVLLSDTDSEISDAIVPLVDRSTIPSTPEFLVDTVTSLHVGNLPQINRNLQQVNEPKAREQVKEKLRVVLTYSSEEQKRQAQSESCNQAFSNLEAVFEKQRRPMQFWSDAEKGLAHFIPWYFQPELNKLQRDAAQPVVEAQRRYEQSCLTNPIPGEMNPTLIKRAVGLLLFEHKVICTGLRTSKETIYTAKHCFLVTGKGAVKPGAANTFMSSALKGQGKFWFIYEAEPLHRFEVCIDSLPKPQEWPVLPHADNVKLTIAATNEPEVPMKWALAPRAGASLYLRGYFPFASGSDLQRLRATAHGGCVALQVKDQCLFHACQSTSVMSGAPVFLRPEPGGPPRNYLEPVALHLGSAGTAAAANGGGEVCEGVDGNLLSLSNFAYRPVEK
ncbi:MAG: hypothetical protein Q8K74_07470 [Candidatus Nitrotoga sp.]|nr:hypothetical protein [Candidatus Nitrotoga sp.]MDP1855870.1 hypothetical protein [Candidatus Nitrotoga sp.]